RYAVGAAVSGQSTSLLRDCPDGCLSSPHPCDGRIQSCVGLRRGEGDVRVYLRRRAMPGAPSPICCEGDAGDRIPRCTYRRTAYCHPYTRETRRTSDQLEPCAFSVTPVGRRIVFDLTIEDVNHYI